LPRPKLEIDPEQVENMAAIGCTVDEMATILGCSGRTLQKRFFTPIERGRSRLNRSLRRKQAEMALNGNVTMLIWLGKQYLGQRERIDETRREEVVTIERIAPKIALADTA
jgi:hypothetical protein